MQPDSHPAYNRNLTLFYGITLGLALCLALLAIAFRRPAPPNSPRVSQAGVATQAATSASVSTQLRSTSPPTPLPAIPATPNEQTPSSLGVTSSELRGLTVSLWHPWSGDAGAQFDSILAEFNRTNRWGVTVQSSDYEGFGRLDEAVEAALVANTLPGVLLDYGYQVRHWKASADLVDLSPYLTDPAWGLSSDEQADFYPEFWAEDLLPAGSAGQSRRLGLPYYRSAYVLFYNRSWGDELGYPNPPATPDDFRLRACAAAGSLAGQGNGAPPGRGGWLVTPQPAALLGWVYAFGGQVILPGQEGYRFNTLKTQQVFEYIKNLLDDGCAWSDPAVEPAVEFASRGALFVVASTLDIPAQQEAFALAGRQDEWVVIPFPSDGKPVVVTYGPSLAVTRSTPQSQLAAWLVIEWLVYPPNQATWAAAIEAYPTRGNALGYLDQAALTSPHWAQALGLLPFTRSEPSLVSWGVVRWALQDALEQLVSSQLDAGQVPSLLENLDLIAAEIVAQER